MDNLNSNNYTFSDINSILTYVYTHYDKFLLLLLAFMIILLVDYISNINAIIYASPQIIPGLTNTNNIEKTKNKIKIPAKTRSKPKK